MSTERARAADLIKTLKGAMTLTDDKKILAQRVRERRDELMTKHHLTESEALVLMVVDRNHGGLVAAADVLGLSVNYVRLMAQRPHFKALLKKHLKVTNEVLLSELGGVIAEIDDIQKFWTELIYDESVPVKDRLRASELLSKSRAELIDVKVVEGGKEPLHVDLSDRIESVKSKVAKTIEAVVVEEENDEWLT